MLVTSWQNIYGNVLWYSRCCLKRRGQILSWHVDYRGFINWCFYKLLNKMQVSGKRYSKGIFILPKFYKFAILSGVHKVLYQKKILQQQPLDWSSSPGWKTFLSLKYSSAIKSTGNSQKSLRANLTCYCYLAVWSCVQYLIYLGGTHNANGWMEDWQHNIESLSNLYRTKIQTCTFSRKMTQKILVSGL